MGMNLLTKTPDKEKINEETVERACIDELAHGS